jgi:hypothetical protein
MNQTSPFDATNNDMAALCERIRGFTHDDASPAEQVQLCAALKLLAEETVNRWELVRKLELELRDKLTMADIREKMSEVLVITEEGNTQRGFRPEAYPGEPSVMRRMGRELAGRFAWPR